MLKPSTTLSPITYDVTQANYIALGSSHARGDARRVISRSDLMFFGNDPHAKKSPYKWVQGAFGEDTAATEWGDLIDCLTLTPERFEEQFVTSPATYPCEPTKKDPRTEKPWSRNADFCKAWEARKEEEGLKVVKTAQLVEARKAVAIIGEDDEAASLLHESRNQVQIVVEYQDKETGIVVPIKCLLDCVPTGHGVRRLVDLKTACDGSYAEWQKKVHRFGYDVQAALYIDAFNVATGEQRNEFVHIVQESDWPYEPIVWPLSEEYLHCGRCRYLEMLRDYCQCLANRNWPGLRRAARWDVVEPPMYVLEQFPPTDR